MLPIGNKLSVSNLWAKPIQVKESPKNANIINGPGVRIIKSCSSQTKSSQV